MQQPEAAKVVDRELGLPVLHLPQLVGLALGFEPKELGMRQARRLDRVGRRAASPAVCRPDDGASGATPGAPSRPPRWSRPRCSGTSTRR